MAYLPIEDYGIIGNMHTAALVGKNGSIDWLCFPHFDSPSVFAAILDDERGGRFQIAPAADGVVTRQLYWPDTNILVTRFLYPGGVGTVTDWMPVRQGLEEPDSHWLLRVVRATRGTVPFHAFCRPAFNYARDLHKVHSTRHGVRFRSDSITLELASSVPLTVAGDAAEARFVLSEGQTATFRLRPVDPASRHGTAVSEIEALDLFDRTVRFWRRWLGQCRYEGRWRDAVCRSALTLKLLTFEPTGAIIAAPTASLPERLGGTRNWDYRYTWIRDAAFTLYAFLRIGFTSEASAFMGWLERCCRSHEAGSPLQVLYGIDGRREVDEEILDHLSGYRGSGPVRVGNGAYRQLQLDIYGELMDAVYLYDKYGTHISYELWTSLRPLVDWVCDHWRESDEGIWEVRGGRQHFVYSKLMCWVALDRALRLARKRSLPADVDRWLRHRNEIYCAIMTRGWHEQRRAFVQAFGSNALDAASLIMPLVLFISPTDPRMLATVDAIYRSPAAGGLVSDGLVYRYDVERSPDGLPGEEGTFNMCTFWLVEALTRAGRRCPERLDQARLLFENMLGLGNHLGLYAEETGPCGEALGNFPQAFTHLGLISAAYNLDRALRERRDDS